MNEKEYHIIVGHIFLWLIPLDHIAEQEYLCGNFAATNVCAWGVDVFVIHIKNMS